MPIRNPFARRPGAAVQNDENLRPDAEVVEEQSHPGFERVDTVGSKASSALSIGSRRSHDNGEYKLSVVNDSGVYLPPSPVEKEPAWPKKYLSRNSTDQSRSSLSGEIEHFSISRESFDSYRRSFDISARSPVVKHDVPAARQSLDSARFSRMPRASLNERRPNFERESPTVEEGFEDVGLNDEQQQKAAAEQPPKKRGFFSKFGSESHPHSHSDNPNAHHQQQQQQQQQNGSTSSPMMSRFLIPGRKRAQSGSQGAELRPMERPTSSEGVQAQA